MVVVVVVVVGLGFGGHSIKKISPQQQQQQQQQQVNEDTSKLGPLVGLSETALDFPAIFSGVENRQRHEDESDIESIDSYDSFISEKSGKIKKEFNKPSILSHKNLEIHNRINSKEKPQISLSLKERTPSQRSYSRNFAASTGQIEDLVPKSKLSINLSVAAHFFTCFFLCAYFSTSQLLHCFFCVCLFCLKNCCAKFCK